MALIHQQTFGHGKPIVLVHGWSMHSGIWQSFAKKLSERYRVTCVDLPGHGLSKALTPFTLGRISDALAEAIDEPQSCWLGWSMGASVVLDLAGRFPERVNALILLAGNPMFTRGDDNPAGDSSKPANEWPGMAPKALDSFSDHFAENAKVSLLSFLALQVHGLPGEKSLLRQLKAAAFACNPPDSETLRQGLRILKEADLRPILSQLQVPVTAILGGRDTLVPVSAGPKMQQLLPRLKLTVLEKAGHVPFLSHQPELVNLISRFMEQG